MIPYRTFNQSLRLDRGKAVFRLPDKLGFPDKARHQRATAGDQVVSGDLRRLPVVREFAIGLDSLDNRGPEAIDVSAAFACRNGVAVAVEKSVSRWRPVDSPFNLAWYAKSLEKIN